VLNSKTIWSYQNPSKNASPCPDFVACMYAMTQHKVQPRFWKLQCFNLALSWSSGSWMAFSNICGAERQQWLDTDSRLDILPHFMEIFKDQMSVLFGISPRYLLNVPSIKASLKDHLSFAEQAYLRLTSISFHIWAMKNIPLIPSHYTGWLIWVIVCVITHSRETYQPTIPVSRETSQYLDYLNWYNMV